MSCIKAKFLLFLSSIAILGLSQCASKLAAPSSETKLIVNNVGTYEMQAPQACYYGNKDAKECIAINAETTTLASGKNISLSIRSDQKIRLILPFDVTLNLSGKRYRPNCHILIDFFVHKEKHYSLEAQMLANLNNLENGFNCTVNIFEQDVLDENKLSDKRLSENVSKYIRYRVPPKGEVVDGYISNYNWQQP